MKMYTFCQELVVIEKVGSLEEKHTKNVIATMLINCKGSFSWIGAMLNDSPSSEACMQARMACFACIVFLK